MRNDVKSLAVSKHTIFELAPGLLLVFKPHGHRENEHAHAHRQRVRVLHGKLVVHTPRASRVLDRASGAATFAPGRRHSTEALEDTWLVAETIGSSTSRGRKR